MKKSIAYILLALMVATAIVYFVEANEEYAEALEEHEEEEEKEEAPVSREMQTIFFTATGIGYIGVGVWMLKGGKAPYIIAIIGSIGLIILYAATRGIMYQELGVVEIGELGVISKVLQGAIIGLSIYALKGREAAKEVM
ncbi:MAG: hypothetical protein D6752_05495 [Candidatus Nitrosothermus koennekii]|nr:MAG: hypothetical protein D6752_05495 [Candidatus Nitrosothermus koennekii]